VRLLPIPDGGAARASGVAISTTRIPDDDPMAHRPLLDLLPGGDTVAWVRGDQGLVGWGVAARRRFGGTERFSRAMSWWHDWIAAAQLHDEVGLPGTGPVAFGSFAFDHRPGTSEVVVPRILIGRRRGATWLTTVGDAALPPRTQPKAPAGVTWQPGTLSEEAWGAAVQRVVARIEAGELDKAVLARDVIAEVAGPLDERYLMEQLHLDYPECWTFHVAGMVGATPELLVRREGSAVTSRVLAGTVRRSASGSDGADAAAAAALLASDKDLNEHAYAVASVADALATHCTDLTVPPGPGVLRLANVQHLVTDVTATLADAAPALALAATLHPTAAVCGTPTERALATIRRLEGMDRGRYAGPVGWFDSRGDGEFGIALRCGQVNAAANTVQLFAGCGLVAGSTPAAELAESAAKFAAMRSALSPAPR
jgi:menaquinone-specific isochorismate synthase